MPELVIRGGRVVDGTGRPSTVADVSVDDGRVIGIGTTSRGRRAGDRCHRPGGVSRVRRHPHPLRRSAPMGHNGQSLGPARGNHCPRGELRVLDRPAGAR